MQRGGTATQNTGVRLPGAMKAEDSTSAAMTRCWKRAIAKPANTAVLSSDYWKLALQHMFPAATVIEAAVKGETVLASVHDSAFMPSPCMKKRNQADATCNGTAAHD